MLGIYIYLFKSVCVCECVCARESAYETPLCIGKHTCICGMSVRTYREGERKRESNNYLSRADIELCT